jgi:hypothetical protein
MIALFFFFLGFLTRCEFLPRNVFNEATLHVTALIYLYILQLGEWSVYCMCTL